MDMLQNSKSEESDCDGHDSATSISAVLQRNQLSQVSAKIYSTTPGCVLKSKLIASLALCELLVQGEVTLDINLRQA